MRACKNIALTTKIDIREGTFQTKYGYLFHNISQMFIETKYTIFDNNNFDPPAVELRIERDDLMPRNKMFAYQFSFNMSYQFYHLKNVYCGTDNDFTTPDDITYYIDCWGLRNSRNKRTRKACLDHAIYLSSAGSGTYGDTIMGAYIRMSFIPVTYFKKSTLVIHINSNFNMYHEILQILNLPDCPLYGLNETENEVIFCRNMYTILPYCDGKVGVAFKAVHLNFFGPIMRTFGNKVLNNLNVTHEPYDYALYNRFKGMRRSFVNFDEMVRSVQNDWPEHNFTTIIGHQCNLTETVRRYGIIKWLFAVAGSNSMNSIFMRPRTMVCMYMANYYDSPAIGAILGSDIMLVGYMNPEQDFVGDPLVVNIPRMLYFVKRSMEILRNEESKRNSIT